ncbi:MAG: xanthine dehydrogenase family protein molybdopterin-binding subunit [Actinomycetia bacterium]|nr:xanthine dehydrogenase family protein molybdopterin-binding subunit [Actinomycetes bacterium]
MTVAIGDSSPRIDGEAKVRGTALYGIDYEEPHYLHGKILRSTVPAGRITKLDTSEAVKIPGVLAVVTAEDVPGRWGHVTVDQPVFATDVVRYEGEPIAAVAAETWNQARAALRAIVLEIEPLEVLGTMQEAMAEGARLLHPGWESYRNHFNTPREGNLAAIVDLRRGDIDAAFAKANHVIEDEFEVQRHHQASIEPRVCTARFENGRYVIHTSTQWPFNVRDGTAGYLGVRTSDVRIVVPTVGGGFGGKLIPTLEPAAALLARRSGRPVKLVNTRKEEFLSGCPRENAVVRVASAVTSDGEILGHRSEVLMDNGAYGGEQPVVAGLAPLMLCSNYRMGAISHTTKLVYTNTPPTGPFRGVLATYCNFALERHADHIANELGIDRREFRLRNIYVDGDESATGQRLEGVAFSDALERLDEVVPWPGLGARRHPYQGVGIACTVWNTNSMPSGASVKLNEDGTATLISSATEIGTGAVAQGLPQIVAAELGLDAGDVVVSRPDTDLAAYDGGAQGGRTMFMAGEAVLGAAREVRDQVLDAAALKLEADRGDLELADGVARVAGAPDRQVSLAAVARAELFRAGPVTGAGRHTHPPVSFDTGCVTGSVMTTFTGASYHVHLAEVEVDPETGEVTILRYAVAQDVGKILNPQAIRGQIYGGVIQGVGYALFEDLRLDEGICLDWGFASYRLPTALDVPPIDVVLLEAEDPVGPHGAKGVAEAPIIPVAAAIANAVSDAIGKPINSIPITPFTVLEALNA